MIIKNWKKIVHISCTVVLTVSLVASGCMHRVALRNNKTLVGSNDALTLELNNNQAMLLAAQDQLGVAQDQLGVANDELSTTKENLRIETEKATGLNDELVKLQTEFNNLTEELEIANTTINDLKGTEYKLVYLGDYKLTHYCPGFHGEPCGTGDGLTATGTKVTAGRTIAVDPKVIPYGTKVYIEGYGWRVAEDCGGGVKGKHIDVAMGTHDEAMSKGVKHRDVWILVKN